MRKALVVFFFVLLTAAPLHAEVLLDKNVQYFQPTVDGSGVLWSYGSEPLGMFRMHYGLWADDAIDNVDYIDPDDELYRVVENQLSGTAVYSVGFFHFLNFGFAFPFIAYRQFNEDVDFLDIESGALGDLRFDLKWTILNRQQKCLGLALLGRVTTPMVYQENSFASDRYPTLSPILIFDIGRRWWTFTTNIGYKYYTAVGDEGLFELETGDELKLNLGLLFRITRTQQIMLDSQTTTLVRSPYGEPDLDYAEALLAYRKYWQRLNFTAVTAGVGVGLLSGVGTPKIRFFVGVTRDERRLSPGDVYY